MEGILAVFVSREQVSGGVDNSIRAFWRHRLLVLEVLHLQSKSSKSMHTYAYIYNHIHTHTRKYHQHNDEYNIHILYISPMNLKHACTHLKRLMRHEANLAPLRCLCASGEGGVWVELQVGGSLMRPGSTSNLNI